MSISMSLKIENANGKGTIYYGMHFYPGVAEYAEPGKEPFRIFLNEDTLRSMDQSFAGRPIFVEHVDEVESNVDELRKDVDGWVVESFYNAADGKHWAKFLVCSERGERAIKNGVRLSNSYVPRTFGPGGQWNGVSYDQKVITGEFEHLALVYNPRYEESVIMTPDEFKAYNENHMVELKRISNSKSKGASQMKLSFFKKSKVENADLDMSVILPKSGKEITIADLVTEADERASLKKNSLADPSDKVKMHDGNMCNVGELLKKHKALCDEMEGMKKNAEEKESEVEVEKKDVDVESTSKDNDDDEDGEDGEGMDNKEDEKEKEDCMSNEEEDEAEDELEKAKKKKNAADAEYRALFDKKKNALKKADDKVTNEKKEAAKVKAARLKNAGPTTVQEEVQVIETSYDQVERGRQRYGSK